MGRLDAPLKDAGHRRASLFRWPCHRFGLEFAEAKRLPGLPEKKKSGGQQLNNFRPFIAAAAICAATTYSGAAMATDYPTRPITWIAPSSAGGGFDVVSRLIAPKLSEVIGQPVVVQNIPGAGATIGAQVAAESKPDGYTILLANANHTEAEALYKNLKYNVLTSFDPVVRFAEMQHLLIANPKIGVNTLADFIAKAKANPGKMNAAHAGVGSPTFLCLKLLEMDAGIELNTIPYKGGGEALASVVSGETDFECSNYAASKSLVEDGTVKALAITSKERKPFAPEMPVAAETVPGFEVLGWFGLLVPKGTPDDVRAKIRSALATTLADPATKKRLTDLGMSPTDMGPEEFAAAMKKDVDETKVLVQKAGIEPR
jgi:tripartite-type tricarboxylate transporter receptor subunit TctC